MECWNCNFWDKSNWIMKKYGEGCGICKIEGKVRFCSHECSFDKEKEVKEKDEKIRS